MNNYFAIGNDELDEMDNVGKQEPCPKCGKMIDVEYGQRVLEDGTRIDDNTLAFIKCDCGTYLVGVNGKRIHN